MAPGRPSPYLHADYGERLAAPMSIHGGVYAANDEAPHDEDVCTTARPVRALDTAPPPREGAPLVATAVPRTATGRQKRGRARKARVVDDSPEPRLLQRRVDALYLAYNGELDPAIAAHLAERTDEARVQGVAAACDLKGWGAALCVSPRSHCARGLRGVEGFWRLSCDELSVTIETGAAEGWVLEVRPSALLLGRIGHEAARACARELAAAILVDVLDERVRRVDLCADFVGYELDTIASEEWIAPRRTTPDDLAVTHRYARAGIVTGWAIGKSTVVHRCYDKTRELRAPGNDAKREEEHARWKAAGWSGRDRPYTRAELKEAASQGVDLPPYEPVTRPEFQVRGDALKQFPGLGDLRNPDVLFRSLDAVWAYLTDARPPGPRGGPAKPGKVKIGSEDAAAKAGWCRLVVLGTATRRHRCRTQRRWRAVQRVTFLGVVMPVPVRERVSAPAPERRMVGQCLDLVSAEGLHEVSVPPLGKRNLVDLGRARDVIAQARDSFAGWNEDEAEAFVRDLLGDHRLVSRFKLATRAWAEDEKRRRGSWKGAAAYFLERMRSSVAKRGKLSDLLLERAALAKCGSEREAAPCACAS